MKEKIGFGGGCHWCTEAVFQSLKGVEQVEQGWVASTGANNSFSEAVIVHFSANSIALKVLVEIHLHTHRCTSNHSMRTKYRSAVYYFDEDQKRLIDDFIKNLQGDFDEKIITQALPFSDFKLNTENFRDYYFSNPEKAFCKTYISPKLAVLMNKFKKHTKLGL
jgi:peptide-methionine (S)-S-oxide reductase